MIRKSIDFNLVLNKVNKTLSSFGQERVELSIINSVQSIHNTSILNFIQTMNEILIRGNDKQKEFINKFLKENQENPNRITSNQIAIFILVILNMKIDK